jgi:RNA polymerase sigma-70 factor (ECF subfamily)
VPPRPDDARSDQDLVAAANRGDADALSSLYLRHRDWALSVAFRFTGDREAAQDVAHEAFVYLLGKFPGFRLTSKMTTFLYPAIRNTALAARRKRRAAAIDDEQLAMFADPAALAGPDAAARAALQHAVSRLPGGQREVVVMRFVDDMTMGEIALALGIPEGTVKSRLHHALAGLKAAGVGWIQPDE